MIKANAKINLFLSVGPKMPTGFHTIRSILCPIDFYDEVEIALISQCDSSKFSCVFSSELERCAAACSDAVDISSSNNIAFEIALCFLERAGLSTSQSVLIKLTKNIPWKAGLGGGSSDAAAVLSYLNEYFGYVFTRKELIEISLEFGSDIAPLLFRAPVYAFGRGEKILALSDRAKKAIFDLFHRYELFVVKPDFEISTKDAYQSLQREVCVDAQSAEEIVACQELEGLGLRVVSENSEQFIDCDNELFPKVPIARWLRNDFFESSLIRDSRVGEVFCELTSLGASKVSFSGSGSALIAVFEESGAKEKLRAAFPETYLVRRFKLLS